MRSIKKVFARMILTLLVLAVGISPLGLVGCGGENKPVEKRAEIGEPFDLYALVEDADYADFTVTKGETEISVEGQYVVFEELGVFEIAHKKGGRWKVTVVDTTAPVVQILGNFLKYEAEDVVSLPSVKVVDNSGETITAYTIEVFFGEEKLEISEKNTFVVEQAGQYTVRASAKDSSGNEGTAKKSFMVSPRTERAVAAGTEITLKEDYVYYRLPEGANPADYDYTYAVYRDGAKEPLTTDTNFTVEANSYYEAYVTATHKTSVGETYTAYVSYVEEHTKVLTFTGLLEDEISAGSTELICNPYGVVGRGIVTDEAGSTSMTATVENASDPIFRADGDKDGNPDFAEGDETLPYYDMPFVLFAWTFDIWGLPNEYLGDEHPYQNKISYTYDVRVEGTLKKESAEFHFGYRNVSAYETLTATGEIGETFSVSGQISADNSAIYWLSSDKWGYGWYQRVVFDDAAVSDFKVYIDNVRFTFGVAPEITAEEEQIDLESGSAVPLSAEALGVTAEDYFGADVEKIEVAKILRHGTEDVTAQYAGVSEIPAASKDEFYDITLRATDFYGNTSEKTVRVKVGDTDFDAPVLTYETDNFVAAGTEISLTAEGIQNYLTVQDASGCSITYEVRKNGVALSQAQSFTVGAGDYYEVYALATDASEERNTAKAYLLFADSGMQTKFYSMSETEFSATQISAAEVRLDRSGARAALAWPAVGTGINETALSTDAYGNTFLKIRPSSAEPLQSYLEIYIACASNASELTGSFTVRVEGETDLPADTVLFRDEKGNAYTVADIGKDVLVSKTGLVDRGDGVTNGIQLKDIGTLRGESGLWICLDNFQLDARQAPAIKGTSAISMLPGETLTFSAAGLGVSAKDYLGATLLPLVTEVRVNGATNPDLTDGYVLESASEGRYEVDFAATDRWGLKSTFTVTVSVAAEDEIAPVLGVEQANHFVTAGTSIRLGQTGIEGFLTATDDSEFTLSYRVLKNGTEELETTEFTVNTGEFYEVYVSAADEYGNESFAYLLFGADNLADVLWTLDGGYEVYVNAAPTATLATAADKISIFEAYPFNGDYAQNKWSALTKDKFGNEYLRLRPKDGASVTELFFFIPAGKSNMTGTFTLRLEGTSGLPADSPLFTLNGKTYTVADLGKSFRVTVEGLNDRGAGNGTSNAINLTDFANLLSEKNVWLIFDHLSLTDASGVTCAAVDNYVAAGTKVSLTSNGIAGYLSVTGTTAFDFSYRVFKNGTEVPEATEFTVGAGEYYEVYVTAESSLGSTVKRYLLFADSALQGVLKTLNGNGLTAEGPSQYEQGVKKDGAYEMFFYPFVVETVTDEYGNGMIKARLGQDTDGQIMIGGLAEGATDLTGSFTFRVEGDTSLPAETVLFKLCGHTVTVADIGKTFLATETPVHNRGDGLSTIILMKESSNFYSESGLYLLIDQAMVR